MTRISTFVMALAGFTLAAAPAIAGGDGLAFKGGYHAHHAKPIPAPVPIPEYGPRYYIGASFNYGFAAHGSVETTGIPVSTYDTSDLDGVIGLGLQIGAYYGSAWRGELALDVRSDQRLTPRRSRTR